MPEIKVIGLGVFHRVDGTPMIPIGRMSECKGKPESMRRLYARLAAMRIGRMSLSRKLMTVKQHEALEKRDEIVSEGMVLVRDIAREYGFSQTTLARMCKEGRIPAVKSVVKIGRRNYHAWYCYLQDAVNWFSIPQGERIRLGKLRSQGKVDETGALRYKQEKDGEWIQTETTHY